MKKIFTQIAFAILFVNSLVAQTLVKQCTPTAFYYNCGATTAHQSQQGPWMDFVVNGNKSNWYQGYSVANATWKEFDNGTAQLSAQLTQIIDANVKWDLVMTFGSKTSTYTPHGGGDGWHCLPSSTADWYYYKTASGTLTGVTGTKIQGAKYNTTLVSNTALQIGTGGSTNSTTKYGMSAWLTLTKVSDPSANTSLVFNNVSDLYFDLANCTNINPNPTCNGNLITNPGFESDLNSWNNWGNTVITSGANSGSKAAAVCGVQGGAGNSVAASAGKTYSLKAFAKVANAPQWAGVGMAFYNSSWQKLDEAIETVSANSYTNYTLSKVAPAGTTSVTVWFWKNSNGCLYVDDYCLTESTPPTVCNNLTSGGTIGSNQSGCSPYTATLLNNITPPSGGDATKAIEYVWLKTTDSNGSSNLPTCDANGVVNLKSWVEIPNSNSATYNPGTVNQTTWYLRCARRADCVCYYGESNIVKITVTGSCPVPNPPTTCTSYTITNADGCSAGPYAFYLNGLSFTILSGTFVDNANGTATLVASYAQVGNASNIVKANITLTGRTIVPGTDSPKYGLCVNSGASTWYYFNAFSGTITQNGVTTNISNYGAAFQVGNGANLNSTAFGASGWFKNSNTGAYIGDFNFGLINPTTCITCNNLTSGGTIGTNQSGCSPYTATLLNNITLPSGGDATKAIEYVWLKTTDFNGPSNLPTCDANGVVNLKSWVEIPNSNSATYNPGTVNQTTWYLRCARRAGCVCYYGESNIVKITITGACPTCNNLTSGGTIGSNQSGCSPYTATLLNNIILPSGGDATKAIEYVWLKTTDSNGPSNLPTCDANGVVNLKSWVEIPNSNSATYNPGTVNQTTWYLRCARRAGCVCYYGESNIVKITITGACPTCNNLTSGGTIGSNQSGCSPYTATLLNNITLPSGGDATKAIEYVWLKTTDPNGPSNLPTCDANGVVNLKSWVEIPNSNSATYNPGTVNQTTWYLRCARRAGCICYYGESNIVKITITGACPTCNNLTSGGTIGSNQSGCSPYTAIPINNITLPSGGDINKAIEYVWLKTTNANGANNLPTCDANGVVNLKSWVEIPNSNSANYNPGTVNETTWYLRCARRSGCVCYYGESNIIKITITGSCPTPPSTCTSYTITNASGCSSGTYAFYLQGTSYVIQNGTFTDNSNGTAALVATYSQVSNPSNIIKVNIILQGRTIVAGTGSPKYGACVNSGGISWYYFTSFSGTIVKNGVTTNISNYGAAFQVGTGANLNSMVYGAAGWFKNSSTGSYLGDINFGLINPTACETCNNLTSGGNIGVDQSGCSPYTATTINNITLPSGGDATKAIEYVWLKTTDPNGASNLPTCDANGVVNLKSWVEIPNSNSATYNPGTVNQTTWYLRCARRAGCVCYYGESNIVKITITNSCPSPCDGFSSPTTILHYNMNSCSAGSGANFSEFTPIVNKGCLSNVSGTIFKSLSGSHSCNPGQSSLAICAPSSTSSTYNTSVYTKAFTFSATITPNSGGRAKLTTLAFYQRSTNPAYLGGGSMVNNRLTKLAVRIKDGTNVVFEQKDIAISSNLWELITIDLSSASGLDFTITKTYVIEIAAYAPILSLTSTSNYIFDIDEVKLNAACFTNIAPLNVDVTGNLNVCNGQTTILTASPNSSAYTYKWSTGATTASIVVSSGTYSVTVTDANGCSGTKSVVVSNKLTTVNIIGNLNVCNGQLTTLTASGGGSYLWSNGAQTSSITVSAGTYSVTATNAEGCTDTKIVSVTNSNASVTIIGNTTVCQGATTQLIANGTGTYLWSNGATTSSITVSAGTYAVTLTNSSGCTASSSITVIEKNCNTATVGDYVWCDKNGNGIQETGEPGIPNVSVMLIGTNVNGQSVNLTTTTDNNGFYSFTNLAAGSYSVKFSTPFSYLPTAADKGGNDATDSDADVTTGMTATFTLAQGTSNTTLDAGYYQPASLGDFVFNDLDNDGIQDAGEPGIAGVTVSLSGTKGDGTPVTLTTTTNTNGLYSFTNLAPGTYTVTFGKPAGFNASPADQGGNDATDSDANSTTGATAPIVLSSGQNNTTIDAGFNKPCNIAINITNKVCNNNNTPSNPNDDTYTFTMTVTGGTGTWQGSYNNAFLGVFAFGPTAYNTPIVLGPFPAGPFTSSNTVPPIVIQNGLDINIQVSDVQNPTCVKNTTVTSTGPCSNANSSIGDKVFCDKNGNGIQDAGEPGIAGVTVTLTGTDVNGTPVTLTTTTDTNGNYLFPNLAAGTYKVTFASLAGYVFTTQDKGGNDATDSDANPTTGMTANIILGLNENNTSVDAGLYQPASLGDFVFNDLDNDGIQDAGESGIAGVTVSLSGTKGDGTSVILTTTTNTNGLYSFTNLAPGTYTVTFGKPAGFNASPADQGGNDATDSDANPTTGATAPIILSSGQNNTTIDAGFNKPIQNTTVGNFVWLDCNKNGIQDAGEIGLQGVSVLLTNTSTGATQTTTTDANGYYLFSNVSPGSYTITFGTVKNLTFTTKDFGTNDNIDSDASSTGLTNAFTVNGTPIDNIDAGLQDNVKPTFSGIPADITVECSAVPVKANPTATDNCDTNVAINFNETILTGSCADSYTIRRSWTATDDCGNSCVSTQIITVKDTQAPVFNLSTVPKDVTLSCGSPIPSPASPTATDNCDKNVTIIFNEAMNQVVGPCPKTLVYRVWEATDNCGNTSTVTQLICITDNEGPVLVNIPNDVTVQCNAIPSVPANISATDVCSPSSNISIQFTTTTTTIQGAYIIKRTWTATDICGNKTTKTQTICAKDTQKPTFTGVPQNITVECNAIPPAGLPVVSDNCDNKMPVTLTETRITGSCIYNYTLKREWSATDDAGNKCVVTQLVTVVDTKAPTLFNIPNDVTIQCGVSIPLAPANIYATDNCSPYVSITFSEIYYDGPCDGKSRILCQWVAKDDCGNTTVKQWSITILGGDSSVFSTKSIKSNTTGINSSNEINLFPNPSKGEINVQLNGEKADRIMVFDITGRKIQDNTGAFEDTVQLFLNGQQKGVYTIQVHTQNGVVTKKVLLLE